MQPAAAAVLAGGHAKLGLELLGIIALGAVAQTVGEVLHRLVAMFVLSLLYKVDSIRPQMNADLAARRAEKSEN